MFDEQHKPLLSSETVAGLRISIAFLVLLPFALYHFRKVDPKKLWAIAGVGFFGNGIPAFLFTASEKGISSSLAGMLNATTPIFTVIIGILLFRLRLKPINYIGVLVGFGGAAGLMLSKGLGDLEAESAYIFLVLCATFCYGVSVNLIRFYLAGVSPVAIASISFTIIGIPTLTWLLSQNVLDQINATPAHWKALGYTTILAVVGTALAVIMFNYVVKLTSAVFASTVTYLMPIVALLWGLLAREYFTWWYAVSIVVILAGVYLTNRK